MGRPFSDLEKSAMSILQSGGNPAQSNDKAVANYWTWRMNPSNSDHDLPAASQRPENRILEKTFILPFSTTLAEKVFARVTISRRAKTASSGFVTALGHKTLATGDSAYPLKNFRPAKVYWRTGGADSGVARPPSRITKRVYKSKFTAGDPGFTAPFGKTAAADGLAERQAAVRTALAANKLITFSPERFPG